MDSRTRVEVRSTAERFRRPPVSEKRPSLRIAFSSDGSLPGGADVHPGELVLEATGPTGDIAEWFNDFWWTDVLHRWMDQAMTVVVEPTPVAMVHPVVLHHVAMIRRVAPSWRVIGRGFASDLSHPGSIGDIVQSGYHEIQVQEGPRDCNLICGKTGDIRPVDEIFAEIRREQQRIGVPRPILVRIPSGQAGESTADVELHSPASANAQPT